MVFMGAVFHLLRPMKLENRRQDAGATLASPVVVMWNLQLVKERHELRSKASHRWRNDYLRDAAALDCAHRAGDARSAFRIDRSGIARALRTDYRRPSR